MLYVGYFFYDVGISLPKLSALLFYARVFHVNGSRFHIMLWIIGGFVISWILFAIFSTIFQCTPIRKAWEPTVPGYCLNTYQWWLGSAISSVIIDAIILVLPMPKLWRLQLKPMRKVIITIIFISGYWYVLQSALFAFHEMLISWQCYWHIDRTLGGSLSGQRQTDGRHRLLGPWYH